VTTIVVNGRVAVIGRLQRHAISGGVQWHPASAPSAFGTLKYDGPTIDSTSSARAAGRSQWLGLWTPNYGAPPIPPGPEALAWVQEAHGSVPTHRLGYERTHPNEASTVLTWIGLRHYELRP